MNGERKPLFDSTASAEKYVENVRDHYRKDHAEFKGQRNEEQQIIAELTSDEARLMLDGVTSGLLSLRWSGLEENSLPVNYETEVKRAGYTWEDFRSEFERMMVGFGIITNRLNREKYDVKSYADMDTADRYKVASVLLSDFLRHNALRFGVDTAGVMKTNFVNRHTDDGYVEQDTIKYDIDKASSDKVIDRNMRERGYRSGAAQHPAVKLSPKDYIRLRIKYPEMKKITFDNAISFYSDVASELAERE